MTAIDFPSAFESLTGHAPFRWQRRLFDDHFVKGDVPAALDLPTGLGKTSVMAIWLIARAHGARLPRRLVYVVDRRAVVDQATAEAEKLRNNLGNVLKASLGLGNRSLPISTLRGQFVDNRDWLADPGAPAIIVGTVDMIGSRLLFMGYGVSRKMRPYHAGLLGADTLVVLDEAHLVPPFEKLLEAIEAGGLEFGPRAEEDRSVVPQFKLLSLSATGRAREGHTFQLSDDDLGDKIIKKRLEAKKTVERVYVGDQKLEDKLAEQAWLLAAEGGGNIRCLVYCDSRETADATRKAIRKLSDGDKKIGLAKVDVETELFVGARRVKERGDANKWLASRGFLAGSDAPRKPAFLLATSAGEVGVDLDADHMVCDLAPWERMVQRLGRVNRRGDGDARIIVVDEGEPKPKKPDDLTPKERRQIIAHDALAIVNELPKSIRGFDASPGTLRDLRLRADGDRDLLTRIDAATTPAPLRPALTRALVDAWSMTSLEEHTGRPEVGPWLRGWIEDEEPQTSVVWREYLPVRNDGGPASTKEIEDFFEAAPPHASEELETETYRVVDWLLARASATLKSKGRRSGGTDPELSASSSSKPLAADDIVALALTPALDLHNAYQLCDLAKEEGGKKLKDQLHRELVGAMLVVDARLRGLTGGLLDKMGDADVPTADSQADWMPPRPEVGTTSEGADEPLIKFRVREAGSIDQTKSAETAWHKPFLFVTERTEEGEARRWLVVEKWKGTSITEDERSVSRPQLLSDHQALIERKALELAENLKLQDAFSNALAIAARLHDEGKNTPRWQRAFNAPFDGKIYAKTKGPIKQALLDGYRHEFGSLPRVEKDAKFKALPPDLQDLVLHLVAARHGYARPIITATGCEDAPPSALEGRARDVALRFAHLQKRWGTWGLAWWESLLRAADQQASRENDARAIAPIEGTRDGEAA
jgi:CRISPR-associated endonuclease/helicase Cas3